MLEGSTLGVHAWNETVKGVLERAWVAEIDAWESMIR
jgi:hypothetical protein